MSRKTAGLVAVENGKITDEALGMLYRKARDAARRVEGGQSLDRILEGFQAALEGRSFVEPQHVVWKTIQIGVHKNVESLRKAIVRGGNQISCWADDILGKIKLRKSKQFLDLVVLSVEELGFPSGAPLKDIYKAAKERGLNLCPAEVGPQLRLQYTNQPADEWLIIAIKPIKDSDGDLLLFSVVHYDGDRWLGADYGHPDIHWRAHGRFVFRK